MQSQSAFYLDSKFASIFERLWETDKATFYANSVTPAAANLLNPIIPSKLQLGIGINLDEDSSGLSVGETLTPFGFTYYVHGWPRSACVKMQIIPHGNTFVAPVLRCSEAPLFLCLFSSA